MTVLGVRRAITLEQVRKDLEAQLAAGVTPMIFYGARTCWWTHRREDLRRDFHDLPVDVRGGVLMETRVPGGFLKQATSNPEAYGKHGIAAFIAAHNDNGYIALTGRPWCETSWSAYNDAIDAAIGRGEWPVGA